MNSINSIPYTSMEPVRIFSLDGGGVRGICSAMIAAEMTHRLNGQLIDYVDIFAGVSIGSVIAGGLTTGFTADQIVTLWENKAKEVFVRSPFRAVTTLNGDIAPKWDLDNLDKLLSDNFKDTLLKDCKAEFICAATETTTREPWYFNRNDAREIPELSHLKLKDVLECSSAAPGYFRSVPLKLHDQNLNFIDGAIGTPNPTQAAYSYAGDPENALIVSIGTGRSISPLTYKQTAQMGFIDWAIVGDVVGLTVDCIAEAVHKSMEKSFEQMYKHQRKAKNLVTTKEETETFVNGKYTRFQLKLKKIVKLDDASEIPYLMQATRDFIGENDQLIQKTSDALKATVKG